MKIRISTAFLLLTLLTMPFFGQTINRKPQPKPAQAALAAPAAPLSFTYEVAFPQPHTHLYEITFTVGNLAIPQLELSLPVWTPGSYLVRDYARNVQDFSVTDANGAVLPWQKANKTTWRISTNGANQLKVFYRVYANELATQTSQLDATHAYFNGASLFMYPTNVVGAKELPYKVKFKLTGATANWRVSSPLALAPAADGYFTAPNYDVLIDSPTEIGTHQLLQFTVREKTHRVAIWPGLPADSGIAPETLTADLAKIIEQGALLFGGLPYEQYLFIVAVQPGAGGGTEHLNANVSMTRPESFKTKRGYQGFLGLESHEFFHCWNVKRIRPNELGPFDYQREVYTNNLWVAEGFTSYYGDLILRRAGLNTANEYAAALGTLIANFLQTPGRKELSPASASYNAWIKHYRPDENSPNSTASYYTSGALLGLALDLEMRLRTNNAKSLDDVMRLLLERHGLPKPGFTDLELQAAFSQIAGTDMSNFFQRYVFGTEDLDFADYFLRAGLQIKGEYQLSPASAGLTLSKAAPGTLGLRMRTTGERLAIQSILVDTPAYEAGLNANDELVALNGRKLDAANVTERLAEIREGQRVELTVFRRERLQTYTLTAAKKPFDTYSLTPLKELNTTQRAILTDWLRLESK